MKQAILVLAGLSLLCAVSSASEGLNNVDIHGFISQGYLKTNHNNYMAETEDGAFEFNELGLNFGTDLTDKLRLGMQFFARDLGINGNDELVLDWAFADYRWRDWLGFQVGRIKMPFGYYNAIRDFDMLRTSVLIPQSVYGELMRDTFSFIKGGSIYGYIPMGGLGNISYKYLIGVANVSEKTGLISAQEDFYSFFNLKVKEASIDQSHNFDTQWETPLEGLLLGGTLYYHKDVYIEGTLGGDGGFADILNLTYFRDYMYFRGYFLTLRYTLDELVFMSEFTENKVQSEISTENSEDEPIYLKGEGLISQGWYVSLSYRFTPLFEAGYAYSEFYPDKTNKDGKDTYPDTPLHRRSGIYGYFEKDKGILKLFNQKEFEAWKKTSTFSFRFDINENWLIKLETAYNDGFGDYTSADNGDHKDLKRYWWLYAVKVTYNF